eukprot:SAG31_NODE_2859_length_4990_cov_113.128399_3_plen_249_part_00
MDRVVSHQQNATVVDVVELWVRPCTFVGVLGYTSFEEPATTVGLALYFDSMPASVAHVLLENPHQPSVRYTSCTNGVQELGFVSIFQPTRSGESGLVDGDHVGVYGDSSTVSGGLGVGLAPHGSQFYTISDSDGFLYVSIDAVDTTNFAGVTATGWIYIAGLAWDANDFARMWVIKGGTEEVVLVNGNDEVQHERWVEVRKMAQVGLSLGDTATMQFHVGATSDNIVESVFFDHLSFEGVGAAPGSLC